MDRPVFEVPGDNTLTGADTRDDEDGVSIPALIVGTAATIAHIATIANEGVDYDLPTGSNWEFSKKVLETLDGIKTGKLEDKFGWNLRI